MIKIHITVYSHEKDKPIMPLFF